MTRGRGLKPKMLTQSEVAGLQDMKKDAQAQLKEIEQYGAGTPGAAVDRAKIQKEIAYIDKTLEEGAVPTVRGANKDRLVLEAAELEIKLKEGLPTRYEMDHPARCPGAVHKHLNWAKRNEANVLRYKEIQRILHPEDPTATDIEKLREEGRRKE